MWTYAPDYDERTPNILLSGSTNVWPTNNGGVHSEYFPSAGPSINNSIAGPSYPALPARCLGSRYLLGPSGSDRLFAGTQKALLEANQAVTYSWTAVTRAAGSYSDTLQWSFDAYGANFLAIASLGTRDYPQFSASETVGTVFANLTNAPKARIMVVQDNALYLFDYDNGTAYPDGWIRSDTGSITSWTPGTAECVSGAFTETVGNVTAAIKHGTGVVVFKDRGMWRGQYVGLPDVVRWDLVTPSVGCIGPLAVVNVDDVLYFVDSQGWWKYDGSRPVSISEPIRNEWRDILFSSSAYANNETQIGVDDVNCVLSIHTKRTSGTTFASRLYYNYRTGAISPPCTTSGFSQAVSGVVESVCNGPYEKINTMPGMLGTAAVGGLRANRNWFNGEHTFAIWNGINPNDNLGTDTLTYTSVIKSALVGDDHIGRTLTRVYPQYRTYSISQTGPVANGTVISVTGYRRPFGTGSGAGSGLQVSASGVYGVTSGQVRTSGYADLVANGNWFGITHTHTTTAPQNNGASITQNYEWMGVEPEYARATTKN